MSKENGAGIRFDETMKGPFALGAETPELGKQLGKQNAHELAIHVTVSIDGLDNFVKDPQHLGGLGGTIDFSPWGNGICSDSGVFNLFSPTDDPEMKYMVYELAFTHDGNPYYLAGHKEVHDDPGFDLWSDTTTLFTTLHEGSTKDGPVIGAGVLSLGISDLLSLMASMKVTNSDGHEGKLSALATFGKFFLGELWDTYGRKAVEALGGK